MSCFLSEGAVISTSSSPSPREHIASVTIGGRNGPDSGVSVYLFVSEACGATAFSTGGACFKPGAYLPYHIHPVSEAVTVVEGSARLLVEGRAYQLTRLDCAHIPAGIAHLVQNDSSSQKLVTHSAFGSPNPPRAWIERAFPLEERGSERPHTADPETIVRFHESPVYELSHSAFFTDLFARRFGAVGICGGYGRFHPGASLPCHIHDYDESITIVEGTATCLVQGRKYELSDYATAYVPKGLPHRFLNTSDRDMAMIWVYAGDEPDRRIVDNNYCSGPLPWPGTDIAVGEERQKP